MFRLPDHVNDYRTSIVDFSAPCYVDICLNKTFLLDLIAKNLL